MRMYDILNVNDEGSLRSPIKSHSHVIVDYPYMVYAAGGEANVENQIRLRLFLTRSRMFISLSLCLLIWVYLSLRHDCPYTT
jgi:hypothetical protein